MYRTSISAIMSTQEKSIAKKTGNEMHSLDKFSVVKDVLRNKSQLLLNFTKFENSFRPESQ